MMSSAWFRSTKLTLGTLLLLPLAASSLHAQGKGGGRGAMAQKQEAQNQEAHQQTAQMAQQMIAQFDSNGDQALNATELQNALMALMQMMQQQRMAQHPMAGMQQNNAAQQNDTTQAGNDIRMKGPRNAGHQAMQGGGGRAGRGGR